MSAVESILVLDRLRQSVAVKELETTRGNQMGSNQMSMRKTASVPNFSQVNYPGPRNSCFDYFHALLLEVIYKASQRSMYIFKCKVNANYPLACPGFFWKILQS